MSAAVEVTSLCPPACATLLRPLPGFTATHASGCPQYRNPHGRAWCATCRRRVQVEDVDSPSTYTARGEESWRVEYLTCGHERHTGGRVVGPAPGAPYAGVVAAPSARRRREGAVIGSPVPLDPWGDDAPQW